MPYLELAPPAALRCWVDCFWWRGGESATTHVSVLPDGAADVIFDVQTSDAFAVGTMTKAFDIAGDTRELVGVRFLPGRAAKFLGVPLRELTDARVPLRDLLSHREVTFEQTLASKVAAVEQEVLRRVARIDEPDARVDAAVALLVRSGGRAAIERVASEANLTRQHLRRKFLDEVGITPKTFARVMRFRKLVESIRRGTVASWADAALEHGYYDQSHMIGEFRELAGTTPEKFHSSYR